MPLNYTQKPSINFLTKAKETIQRVLNYLYPEIFVVIFLFASLLFEVFNREVNWGWYLAFSILIIGYFVERIIIKVKKPRINPD